MSKMSLYIVTGASGSGKTFVVKELRRIMPDFDVFDYDRIHQIIKHGSHNRDNKIEKIWLRVARDIAESGRTTIICGLIKPRDIKKCRDFHYFKHIYYLVLHCDDQTREKRLLARKSSERRIKDSEKLAKWFVQNADKYTPPMPIIDTSNTDVTIVAEKIRDWVYGTISDQMNDFL